MKTYVKYDSDNGNSYSYEYDTVDCLTIPENVEQKTVEDENNSNINDGVKCNG